MPPQVFTSALDCRIVAPQPDDLVCDLGAAPGNKMSHMVQFMDNHGIIVLHEPVHTWLAMLEYNLKHLGISNVVTTLYTGQNVPLRAQFTRALVDAPCSVQGQLSLGPTGACTVCASCPGHVERLAAFAKAVLKTGV